MHCIVMTIAAFVTYVEIVEMDAFHSEYQLVPPLVPQRPILKGSKVLVPFAMTEPIVI